jgi:alpha-glucuronidase
MRDSRTLIQRIYDDHFEGYRKALEMREKLRELPLPDADRQEALSRMDLQVENAREWRDVVNTFFLRLSGIPDGEGRFPAV